MKVAALFVVASVIASPLGPPASTESIPFAPTEGLMLVRTFETVSEVDSENTSQRGSGSSTSSSERRLVVTDELGAVEGGRILRLERTFDEIASESENSMEFGDNSHESSSTGSSEIEGATVVFEWNGDDEEYTVSSDEVDEDVLEELVFDYDFTAFLPAEEVEEGGEWAVDVEAFQTLVDPWEGFPWEWVDSEGESFSGSDDDEEPEVDESEDGDITATFVELRDAGGVSVAVIALEGEIEIERAVDATRSFDQGSSKSHSETSETREVQGEVLWNVEAGRLHALEIEIALSASVSTSSTASFGEREFENESESERDGTLTFSASLEVAE